MILHRTGIYLAYPTSTILKSIYPPKKYKTRVNDQHTMVGIARNSFLSRKRNYMRDFDNEIEFVPVALIGMAFLVSAEEAVIEALRSHFSRVGRSKEWFMTSDRRKVFEIIVMTLKKSGIEHDVLLNEWEPSR